GAGARDGGPHRPLRGRREPLLPAREPGADVPLARRARAGPARAPRAAGLQPPRRLHGQARCTRRLPAHARRARAHAEARARRRGDMGGGLPSPETGAGPLAPGAPAPEAPAEAPPAATCAIHCSIAIDDVDRFVPDVDHPGSITGTVDSPP